MARKKATPETKVEEKVKEAEATPAETEITEAAEEPQVEFEDKADEAEPEISEEARQTIIDEFLATVTEDEPDFIPGNCINCGQEMAPMIIHAGDEKPFECPQCGYRWGMEAEQAPFRKVQRREK